MRSKGFEGMTCSMASVMGALGDRWGALIVRDLYLGLTRYDDLQRSTSVTNATLSDRLKALEQNGLIERRRYQSRPDRYEYVLTEKGRDIGLVLLAMVQVGDKWNLNDLDGPPLRFFDARSGHRVQLALVDAQTGKPIDPAHISVEAGPGADDLTKWRVARRAISNPGTLRS
ncbi:helix-turn-helix domain-containing protein [Aquabacter sp. CN5-332]|uniref:winged helix-turn-helix transcriptional regulator n=1 Tax=Aquabacter sp. CN5-332 TaxID=3156608 RepID=UPI0032B44D03